MARSSKPIIVLWCLLLLRRSVFIRASGPEQRVHIGDLLASLHNTEYTGRYRVLENVWVVKGELSYRAATAWKDNLFMQGDYSEKFENRETPKPNRDDSVLLVTTEPTFWPANWYHLVKDHTEPIVGILIKLGLWAVATGPAVHVDVLLRNYRFKELSVGTPYVDFLHTMFGETSLFLNASSFTDATDTGANHTGRYYSKVVILGTCFPSYGESAPEVKNRDSLAALRYRAAAKLGYNLSSTELREQKKLLLVTRKAGSTRSFVNNFQLEQALKDLPATVTVEARDCNGSWKEQFDLFFNVDIVIAAHGACLTNLLWMRPESVFIEVFPFLWNLHIYGDWAERWLSLRYFISNSAPYYANYPIAEGKFISPSKFEQNTTMTCEEPNFESMVNFRCRRDQPIVANVEEIMSFVRCALNPSCVTTKTEICYLRHVCVWESIVSNQA